MPNKISKREAELISEHKRINPRSRAHTIIRFTVNTSARHKRGCILCGEECPGWSGKYPRTLQSIQWERDHRAKHGV